MEIEVILASRQFLLCQQFLESSFRHDHVSGLKRIFSRSFYLVVEDKDVEIHYPPSHIDLLLIDGEPKASGPWVENTLLYLNRNAPLVYQVHKNDIHPYVLRWKKHFDVPSVGLWNRAS